VESTLRPPRAIRQLNTMSKFMSYGKGVNTYNADYRFHCRLVHQNKERKFGICRVCFRELAHDGQIPGVKKESR
jgi:ribosomal protein S14